jgi:hypothetical protein
MLGIIISNFPFLRDIMNLPQSEEVFLTLSRSYSKDVQMSRSEIGSKRRQCLLRITVLCVAVVIIAGASLFGFRKSAIIEAESKMHVTDIKNIEPLISDFVQKMSITLSPLSFPPLLTKAQPITIEMPSHELSVEAISISVNPELAEEMTNSVVHVDKTDLVIDEKNTLTPESTLLEWAKAWSEQDVDKYLSYYANSFSPQRNISRKQWEHQREMRLGSPLWIKVEVNKVKTIYIDQANARVSFSQNFSSNTFDDFDEKLIVMILEDNNWKILSETSTLDQ